MSKRIVKAYEDITLTEVTQSDGKNEWAMPRLPQNNSDMGAAESYFEELIIGRLNPPQ